MIDIVLWSNLLVLPFWLLMTWFPRWHRTRQIMSTPWPVAPAAVLFVLLLLPQARTAIPTILFNPTTDGMRSLLSSSLGIATAWVHMITVDLFLGRWAYLESRQYDFPPLHMFFILLTTLTAGPVGFLVYLVYRSVRLKNRGVTASA